MFGPLENPPTLSGSGLVKGLILCRYQLVSMAAGSKPYISHWGTPKIRPAGICGKYW